MKTCKKCGQTKPPSEFYAMPKMKDGLASACKECTKRAVSENRLKNLDHYKAYDQNRNVRPDRVLARSNYAGTDAGKLARAAARKRYDELQPLRRAARVILGNAVRDGRVVPWPVCAEPECCETKVEAHHTDYSRPLEVVWLCTKHHKQVHKEALLLLKNDS